MPLASPPIKQRSPGSIRSEQATSRAMRSNRSSFPGPSRTDSRKHRSYASHNLGTKSTSRTTRRSYVDAKNPTYSKELKAVAVSFAVAGVFAVVVAHVLIDQTQFRIDSMQSSLSKAQQEQTSLQYNLSELEAPQRIVTAAEGLGMVPPAQVTYLTPVPIGTAVPLPVSSRIAQSLVTSSSNFSAGQSNHTIANSPSVPGKSKANSMSNPNSPKSEFRTHTTSPTTSPTKSAGSRAKAR